MRPLHLITLVLFPSVATASMIAACVGDDPSPFDAAAADGGTDGQDFDADPTGDGSPPRDDSSTGADADAGADAALPPLDVRTLPGLRLWLESMQQLTKAAVGNDLVSWTDSSGRWTDGGAGAPDGGPHTAFPVPFTGGGAVNPSVVVNGIAGRPSVEFESGPRLGIANHTDFDVSTGDFVIAAVAAVSSGTGPFWNLTTASTAPSGTWLSSTKFCSFLGGLGTQPKCTSPEYSPNTSPHVFIVRRKAAQAIYRVDGTSRATYDFGVDPGNLGVQTFQQERAVIGGGVVAQISELLLIVGPTTDANFDALEKHLAAKYAIP